RRRTLVGLLLTIVVFAVIGLLYLQAVAQSQATRAAWMVTRDVPAGTVLDAGNVKLVHLPAGGDQFSALDQTPSGGRAAYRAAARRWIPRAALLSSAAVQVPVPVKVAPGVGAGAPLDLYAVVGARPVLVGRRLVVVAPGNPMTVLVAATDEPYWVT